MAAPRWPPFPEGLSYDFRAPPDAAFVAHKPHLFQLLTNLPAPLDAPWPFQSHLALTSAVKISPERIRRNRNRIREVATVYCQPATSLDDTGERPGRSFARRVDRPLVGQKAVVFDAPPAGDFMQLTAKEAGAFLCVVSTDGGLARGRAGQRYCHLQAGALYSLSFPAHMQGAQLMRLSYKAYEREKWVERDIPFWLPFLAFPPPSPPSSPDCPPPSPPSSPGAYPLDGNEISDYFLARWLTYPNDPFHPPDLPPHTGPAAVHSPASSPVRLPYTTQGSSLQRLAPSSPSSDEKSASSSPTSGGVGGEAEERDMSGRGRRRRRRMSGVEMDREAVRVEDSSRSLHVLTVGGIQLQLGSVEDDVEMNRR